MADYPQKVSKVIDGETVFDQAHMNLGLLDLERRTDSLNERLENIEILSQRTLVKDAPLESTVMSSRVVYYNGSKWDTIDGLVPLGEVVQNFPAAIVSETTTATINKTGTLITSGLIYDIDSSIVEDLEGPQVGVPYYLSPSIKGKITATQPQAAVYMGVFLTQTSFLLNIQFLTVSHLHRRTRLDPSKWMDNLPNYLLYPAEYLGQIPLPFQGTVLALGGTYMPKYGPYEVDVDGIKIIDDSYFETLMGLSAGTLFATISDSAYDIEAFWSDPRSLTVPGISRLRPGTPTVVIENQIPGQPNDTGSLVVKNIPVLNTDISNQGGETVVKDIAVLPDGTLEVRRGKVVEKVYGGSNVTTDGQQGSVTVSSGVGQEIEQEFTEVFLKGALSKLFPNTIQTYVEYPYQRTNGAIYKYTLPDNVDTNSVISIYATYFGLLQEAASIPVVLRYNVISNFEYISEAPTIVDEVLLGVDERYKLNRNNILQVSKGFFKANNTLFVEVERQENSTYLGGLGIMTLTIKYKVK